MPFLEPCLDYKRVGPEVVVELLDYTLELLLYRQLVVDPNWHRIVEVLAEVHTEELVHQLHLDPLEVGFPSSSSRHALTSMLHAMDYSQYSSPWQAERVSNKLGLPQDSCSRCSQQPERKVLAVKITSGVCR